MFVGNARVGGPSAKYPLVEVWKRPALICFFEETSSVNYTKLIDYYEQVGVIKFS